MGPSAFVERESGRRSIRTKGGRDEVQIGGFLGGLTRRVAELTSRGDLLVYFKHEETAEGALYAEELLAAIRAD